MRTDVLV